MKSFFWFALAIFMLGYSLIGNAETSSPLASAAPPPAACAEPANTWIQINAPGATVLGNVLASGGQMGPGTAVLCSPAGNYVALFQADGNFVVYFVYEIGDPANPQIDWSPVWASNTAGQVPAQSAVMQPDCNFVTYSGSPSQFSWASNTVSPATGICSLVLQDYGNLVIYANYGSTNAANPTYPVWSSSVGFLGAAGNSQNAQNWLTTNMPGATCVASSLQTGVALNPGQAICSTNGNWVAVYQTDGNFVVYNTQTGQATWNLTGSMGVQVGSLVPPGTIYIQDDCNLVVYAGSPRQAAWSSGTNTLGNGCNLQMQNDGNLVVYTSGNTIAGYQTALWSTQSPGYTIPHTTVSYAVPNGYPVCIANVDNMGNLTGSYTIVASGSYSCLPPADPGPGVGGAIWMTISGANGLVTISTVSLEQLSGTWSATTSVPIAAGTYTVSSDLSCGLATTTYLVTTTVTCSPPMVAANPTGGGVASGTGITSSYGAVGQ